MRRRLLRVAVLACAFATVAAAPARAALETILQDDAVMLYSTPEDLRAATQRLVLLGVDRVRITANWSVLTRAASSKQRPAFDARDPAAYEQARWTNLDSAVRAADAAGLRVMIDVGFWAPRWATTAPPGRKARMNVKPGHYADFAVAVARRYSGTFVVPSGMPAPPPAPAEDENPLKELLFPLLPPGVRAQESAPARVSVGQPPAAQESAPAPVRVRPPAAALPRVDVFALWNEPNHPGLLLPQWRSDRRTPASPGIYRRMVRAAYPAVKKARRDARLLIGNTSSVGGTRGKGAVAPLEFVRELACVDRRLRARRKGGCASYAPLPGDGWAHHPYTRNESPRSSGPGPDDVHIADLPALARTLRRLVRRGRLAPGYRRIYVTEFGFETKRVGNRPRVSESAQARWLTWSEYLADRVAGVRSFAQLLLRDQPPAPTVISNSEARPFGEYSTGLLRAGGEPKTAARTFRAGLFAHHRGSGRVLLYGRLRLGPGLKAVTVERRVRRGAWQRVLTVSIDGQGAFRRTVRHRRDSIYRLTYPGRPGVRKRGLAIRPVSRWR